MARLNVDRMMRTLKQDKKKMEAAKLVNDAPTPSTEKEVLPVNEPLVYAGAGMNAVELERWLTEVLVIMRDANRRYNDAVCAEMEPNSVVQDVLHALEFTPQCVEPNDMFNILVEARRVRREVKKELEVSTLFKEWADKHKTAFDQLQQTVGTMRKILNRQSLDAYRWKTDRVGTKGEFLQIPEESPV